MVSVVVPIYNKQKYIDRCVASIRNQSYTNIEIILVDDGSSDNSVKMIDEYAAKDNRVKAIHQKNQGEGGARNTGIDNAKGEYMLFVDADDWLEQDAIELTVSEMENNPADCIVFENYIIDEALKSKIPIHSDLRLQWTAGTKEFIYAYLGDESRRLGTAVWNKLYNTKIIKDNHIKFSNLNIGEDTIFCLEYAMYSRNWIKINKPLYYYYQNEDSVMHNYDDKFIGKINSLMDAYEHFAEKYGLLDYLLPAIKSKNVIDIFNIYKYKNISRNIFELYWEYKKLMGSQYYKKAISNADLKNLNLNYKIVYYLCRYRLSLLMIFLVKLYKLKYRL